MNATDAAAVLLAREIESRAANAEPLADLSRADEEARRAVGEHASFEDWLSYRAQWIIARTVSSKAVGAPSSEADGWTWIAAMTVLLAFAIGVASDAIGSAHRINILAPPLLALLAWNLAVYAVLALRRLPGWPSPARDGLVRRALGALLERGHRLATAAPLPEGAELRARHARAWAGSSRDLWAARVAATVHAAAAMLVMGALCSLYLRGLALEYRAGWESTFLDAASVHALLTAVLGPAAQLSGIALPDVGQLAALRAGAGPGENAARWIHLYAITLALVVILPRGVLALVAVGRARRLARRFPLPLDDAYFARLHRIWSGRPTAVQVLPYSYHLNAAQAAALRAALAETIAPQVDVTLLDTAPLGAEDDLARWIGSAPAANGTNPVLVVLFSLAATPEREHHGALLRALMSERPGQRVLAVVDESSLRRRLHGADHGARLEDRRRAWRALVGDAGAATVFVDLELAADAVGNGTLSVAAGADPARRA